MIYSRRLRVEQKNDKKNTVLYIFYSVLILILLFQFGIPNAAKFIGFIGDFKNASDSPEQEDKTPPPPPFLDNIPKATNEFSLDISGNTEPGVTVILTVNGKEDEVLANSDGKFNYTFSLNDGENTLSAIAKDKAGNESVQSQTKKVTFDDEPPVIEITAPKDGETFFGSAKKQLTISGKTDEHAKVQINGRWVITNSDGSFNYVYGLADGENKLAVSSEDEAGNKTEQEITVTFTP